MNTNRRDVLGGISLAAMLSSAARGQALPGAALNRAPDTMTMPKFVSLEDLEAQAEKIMSPGMFGLIAGGEGAEWTLHENRAAFTRVALQPHYLSGVAEAKLSTSLLGIDLNLPILTTPMGNHGAVHVSAEGGSARGTAEAGALFTAGTLSNLSLEEIAALNTTPKFFQLYFLNDRGFTGELLQRAKRAGYRAIVLTIDGTDHSVNERVARLGFRPPSARGNVGALRDRLGGAPFMKPELDWRDVEFVQRVSGLPVMLKGVLSADMAGDAVKRGIAGIQVSNHGGRQLDGLPASFTVLPEIADTVAGRVPIIFDSGIRRGVDVFKALALGANAVAIGRPVLYGLGLGGWMGVKAVYDMLRTELAGVMIAAGTPDIASITRRHVRT